MKNMQTVIKKLENSLPNNFLRVATEILCLPLNFSALLYDYIFAMSDQDFYHYYLRGYHYDRSPEVFLIYEDPQQHFTINLNYFNSVIHSNLLQHKRVTPHRHHFSFVTRILHGEYIHWVYHNHGTMQTPKLSMAASSTCKVNDVYLFPSNGFHIVLNPSYDTLTLMIRKNVDHTAEKTYFSDKDSILARKKFLLAKLKEFSKPNLRLTGNLLNYSFDFWPNVNVS